MKMNFANFFVGVTLVVVVYGASIPIKCLVDLAVSKQHRKCDKKYICTVKHPDFPQECIDRLLQEKYKMKFVESDLGRPIPRDGEADYNDLDCPKTDVHYGPIYQIIDPDDRLRVVVQSKHFNQTVSIERCLKPNSRLKKRLNTDHFTPLQMREYYIYSEQITLDYNFLVLSLDGTEIELIRSKEEVPVACTCRVRPNQEK